MLKERTKLLKGISKQISLWNRLVPFSDAPKQSVGQEGKNFGKIRTNLGRFLFHIAKLESILNFGSHSLGKQRLLEVELLFTSLVHHFQRLVISSKKKLVSLLIVCNHIFVHYTYSYFSQ